MMRLQLFKRRTGTFFTAFLVPLTRVSFLLPLVAACVLALDPASNRAAESPTSDSIEIEDSGYRRNFEIVKEETGPLHAGVQWTKQSAGRAPKIVLYERGVPRTLATRRILTQRVLVRRGMDFNMATFASIAGTKSVQEVSYAPGYVIVESAEVNGALQLASLLRATPGVLSAEPILGKRQWTKSIPNDPLFADQWYLGRSGQIGGAGIGMNVTNVWANYRGKGVTIAIVDDSLQLTHPDLAPNVITNIDYDFRDNDDDPSPGGDDDYHGTTVAGIAAAPGNNSLGIVGVAFEASLLGIRLIGGDDQTDEQNASALLHQNQIVQVSNNSWGPEDDGRTLEGPGPLTSLAFENAVRNGRGGKGTIFVWPVGNGREQQDNGNYDGYANSIYTIGVAAVNFQGRQCSYSEPGACLVIAAPSHGIETADRERILTTDLVGEQGLNYSMADGDLLDINYTKGFGGSSAATALTSGVVALLLNANPLLGWRDVQEILIKSATKVDAADADWMTNGAGLHFNHKFGAGLINAEAAINLATNWSSLASQTNIFLHQTNLQQTIPDNNALGVIRSFDFRSAPSLRVEHVVVTTTIAHLHRGDLAITLISPNGTRSRLAERHLDKNADYKSWKFMSVFNWGEHSQGRWDVEIVDQRQNEAGTLISIRIDLFGTTAPLLARPVLVPTGFEDDKFKMVLTGVSGGRYEVQGSTDLANWIGLAQATIAPDSNTATFNLAAVNSTFRFYRAVRLTSSQ